MAHLKFHAFIPFEGIPEEIIISSPLLPNLEDAHVTSPSSAVCTALHHHQVSPECKVCIFAGGDGDDGGAFPLQLLECFVTKDNGATQDRDYSLLISEFDKIGWQRIENVGADMQSFSVRSSCGMHVLHCNVPAGFPAIAPSFEVLLPVPLKSNKKKLKQCIEEWDNLLVQLKPFFSVMQELDSSVLVLDPQTPQPHHTHRRLMLENQVFLEVKVSPTSPLSPPHCRFIGPSDLTATLHARLSDVYQRWDGSEGLLHNIEVLLQERVVRRDAYASHALLFSSSNIVEEAECVICYSFQTEDGQLPDLVCDHCRQSMHHSCLYQWLSGLADSRQSMQFICGDCPYCSKPISCKVPV